MMMCITGVILLFSPEFIYANTEEASPQPPETELCKHVIPGPNYQIVDAIPPKFFQDIKQIFIFSNVDIKAKDYFDRHAVSELAACVLKAHLNNYGSTTSVSNYTPIHVVDNGDGQPQSAAEGSLVINVAININDKLWYEKEVFQKLVTAQFLYFRSDKSVLSHLSPQCAVSFPFAEDKEERQKMLTYASQKCLSNAYSSSATFHEHRVK